MFMPCGLNDATRSFTEKTKVSVPPALWVALLASEPEWISRSFHPSDQGLQVVSLRLLGAERTFFHTLLVCDQSAGHESGSDCHATCDQYVPVR
ncbi:MAG: hypothetical protein ACI9HA_003307 [Dinoroseobacter sp.]|jgi:hypothetical protein